jgi:hypothetical protein
LQRFSLKCCAAVFQQCHFRNVISFLWACLLPVKWVQWCLLGRGSENEEICCEELSSLYLAGKKGFCNSAQVNAII